MDINTCFELTKDVHTIVYYTHLTPIIISSFLAIYLLIKTKYSLLSKIFLYFTAGFNFWLLCDIVTWTTQNYHLVTFFWSLFDYTNIIFFLYGLYFLAVLIKQKDIEPCWRWIGLVISLPALILVVTGNSVHTFDQPTCGNNLGDNFLNIYKNIVEVVVMIGVVVLGSGVAWVKRKIASIRNQIIIITTALISFFLTFTVTDYISVQTNVYQIGLYGLFVMPLFLSLIVYSIVKYQAFNIKLIGAQALIVTIVAVVGSQFFFIQSDTNRILTAVTLIIVGIVGINLIRSVKKEIELREKIEKLAIELQRANKQQEILIRFIGHEMKGYLTTSAGAFAGMLDGDYGPIESTIKSLAETSLTRIREGVNAVMDILNNANYKSGTLKSKTEPYDMNVVVRNVLSRLNGNVSAKGLKINVNIPENEKFTVVGDAEQMGEHVVRNVIDNAVKYTLSGDITIALSKNKGKVLFSVKDTGVGIPSDDMKQLFTEGGRGKNSLKINVHSTGYGLAIAKKIVENQHGRIWAESAGEGKGSQFYVELPEVR